MTSTNRLHFIMFSADRLPRSSVCKALTSTIVFFHVILNRTLRFPIKMWTSNILWCFSTIPQCRWKQFRALGLIFLCLTFPSALVFWQNKLKHLVWLLFFCVLFQVHGIKTWKFVHNEYQMRILHAPLLKGITVFLYRLCPNTTMVISFDGLNCQKLIWAKHSLVIVLNIGYWTLF